MKLDSSDGCILSTPFTFDPILTEILVPALTGAPLYTIPNEIRGKSTYWDDLSEFMKANKEIQFFQGTKTNIKELKYLPKKVFGGGELFTKEDAQEIYDVMLKADSFRSMVTDDYIPDGPKLYVGYGLTETLTYSMIVEITKDFLAKQNKIVPLGKAISPADIKYFAIKRDDVNWRNNFYEVIPGMEIEQDDLEGEDSENVENIEIFVSLHVIPENLKYLKNRIIEYPPKSGKFFYRTKDIAKIDHKTRMVYFGGRIDNSFKLNSLIVQKENIQTNVKKHPAVESVGVAPFYLEKSSYKGKLLLFVELNWQEYQACQTSAHMKRRLKAEIKERTGLEERQLVEIIFVNDKNTKKAIGATGKRTLPVDKWLEEYRLKHAPKLKKRYTRKEVFKEIISSWRFALGNDVKLDINESFSIHGGESIAYSVFKNKIEKEFGFYPNFADRTIIDTLTIKLLYDRIIEEASKHNSIIIHGEIFDPTLSSIEELDKESNIKSKIDDNEVEKEEEETEGEDNDDDDEIEEDSLEEAVLSVVQENVKIRTKVRLNSKLADLGILENEKRVLMASLEEKLGIRIMPELITESKSVKDIYNAISVKKFCNASNFWQSRFLDLSWKEIETLFKESVFESKDVYPTIIKTKSANRFSNNFTFDDKNFTLETDHRFVLILFAKETNDGKPDHVFLSVIDKKERKVYNIDSVDTTEVTAKYLEKINYKHSGVKFIKDHTQLDPFSCQLRNSGLLAFLVSYAIANFHEDFAKDKFNIDEVTSEQLLNWALKILTEKFPEKMKRMRFLKPRDLGSASGWGLFGPGFQGFKLSEKTFIQALHNDHLLLYDLLTKQFTNIKTISDLYKILGAASPENVQANYRIIMRTAIAISKDEKSLTSFINRYFSGPITEDKGFQCEKNVSLFVTKIANETSGDIIHHFIKLGDEEKRIIRNDKKIWRRIIKNFTDMNTLFKVSNEIFDSKLIESEDFILRRIDAALNFCCEKGKEDPFKYRDLLLSLDKKLLSEYTSNNHRYDSNRSEGKIFKEMGNLTNNIEFFDNFVKDFYKKKSRTIGYHQEQSMISTRLRLLKRIDNFKMYIECAKQVKGMYIKPEMGNIFEYVKRNSKNVSEYVETVRYALPSLFSSDGTIDSHHRGLDIYLKYLKSFLKVSTENKYKALEVIIKEIGRIKRGEVDFFEENIKILSEKYPNIVNEHKMKNTINITRMKVIEKVYGFYLNKNPEIFEQYIAYTRKLKDEDLDQHYKSALDFIKERSKGKEDAFVELVQKALPNLFSPNGTVKYRYKEYYIEHLSSFSIHTTQRHMRYERQRRNNFYPRMIYNMPREKQEKPNPNKPKEEDGGFFDTFKSKLLAPTKEKKEEGGGLRPILGKNGIMNMFY